MARKPDPDLLPIEGCRVPVKPFRPRTERQTECKILLEVRDLVFMTGPAGSAKTHLGCAQAIDDLKSGRAKHIILSRPARNQEEEEIGYLGGSKDDKMLPRVMPLLDGLAWFIGMDNVRALLDGGIIEIVPLAFIGGRTFDNAALLLDEMQNCTAHTGMMAITRAGEGCRVVVTGDPDQSILRPGELSFMHDLDRFRNRRGIGFFEFGIADCVRSRLVRTILACYEPAEDLGLEPGEQR